MYESNIKATSGLTPLTSTSSTQLFAANATLSNALLGLQVSNTSATLAASVSVLDGSTVIWAGQIAPSATAVVPLQAAPLKGTINTAMNIQMSTSGGSILYNAQGVICQ